ncbi:MAG: protein kinase domain-containing protein, partial [Polyangiaceae bacterium]
MNSLQVGIELVAGLDAGKKHLAAMAADCFARAGDAKTSAKLHVALGDPGAAARVLDGAGDRAGASDLRAKVEGPASARAASDTASRVLALRLERAGRYSEALTGYLKQGQVADAARVTEAMGRLAEAGKLYDDAGVAYDAARCFLAARDDARALDALARVPREHPQYRAACVQAIRLAATLRAFDFQIDQFLVRFVADGPRDAMEVEAFYVLGQIYASKDFAESAIDVFTKIIAVRPGYRDVDQRLKAVGDEARGSKMAYAQVVRDDAAFQAAGPARAATARATRELPNLPDLPQLDPHPAPAHAPTAVHVPLPARAPAPAPAPAAAQLGSMGDLPKGATIADRYCVEAKLGQGGMAAVYRVMDTELGESVAMKIFFQSADAQLISRFKQELTLSRQLAHPNIVRLYDLGTHEGCKFLTMELLVGRDLRAILDEQPIATPRALKYLIAACQGLAVAHERGIIHRDIKPENLFVTTADDLLKVMDFGIAKGNRAAGLTAVGFIAGTPAYMSPEQINNFGAVTHLSDLYSLGIIAYEMFTGAVPFDHEELMGLLSMHMTQKPAPPSARNPRIPAELEDIILRLLEKDPARRIQSCRDLASQLAELRPW